MDRWIHSQACLTLTCPFLNYHKIMKTTRNVKHDSGMDNSNIWEAEEDSDWSQRGLQQPPKVREVASTLTFQMWLTALSVHSATSMEWLCWPIRGPKQVRTGMVSAVHTPINGRTPTTEWLEQLTRVLRQELNPHKESHFTNANNFWCVSHPRQLRLVGPSLQ